MVPYNCDRKNWGQPFLIPPQEVIILGDLVLLLVSEDAGGFNDSLNNALRCLTSELFFCKGTGTWV